MMRSILPIFALFAWIGCAGAPSWSGAVASDVDSARPVAEQSSDPVAEAAAGITPADMYERIATLSSDEMGGRDTPSPGLEAAARYIAGEFERFGLRPAGDDGGYIQRYALQRRALIPDEVRLAFTGAAETVSLEFGKDFFVLPGEVQQVEAGVVYAGSAADASARPAFRDRVVVFDLPVAPDDPGFGRSLDRARAAAADAGAAAVLIRLAPAFPAEVVRRYAEHFSLAAGLQVGEVEGPPAFLVADAAADRLFAAAGIDGAAAGHGTAAAPLDHVTARLAAPLRIEEDLRAPNVVAVLPGSDPALSDTYVVFSAHMDHVGIGKPNAAGDSIYNGADDNASGTSALIEVAQAFASLPEPPARSLVFLAVSGEEKGLLGSRYYSDHPTVPLDGIVANINVDMIGRNAPDSIVVIGQEYSSLGPLVQEVAADRPELGLTVSRDIWPEQRFFFRSDHFNFARKEIPALFFFAGVHEDYHQPSDHVSEIDTDKAARVARLIFYTAHEIATRPEPPQWSEEGLAEIRALTGGGR